MADTAITLTEHDKIAHLVFDQPNSKANVLSPALWQELEDALDALAKKTHLNGLILSSNKSGVFIAGADLKFLAEALAKSPAAVEEFIQQGHRVLNKLEALPFPTVAAIDGAALGGGLEVALACDNIVMGTNPKVQLGLPEIKLGLIPGWGGTQRLPRLIGAEEALDRLLSGESYAENDPPPEDLATVVESSQLLSAAKATLNHDESEAVRYLKQEPIELYDMPPKEALASIKASLDAIDPATLPAALEVIQVVLKGGLLPFADAIELETEAFVRLTQTSEAKQLIDDFFNKRKRT